MWPYVPICQDYVTNETNKILSCKNHMWDEAAEQDFTVCCELNVECEFVLGDVMENEFL